MEVIIRRVGRRDAYIVEDTVLFGVKVPEGFKTDGATVPRPFRIVLSPFTEALYAAIVHDYQLSLEGDDPVKRKQIDLNFYNNLKASGVGEVRSTLAYGMVRIWSVISQIIKKKHSTDSHESSKRR